MLKEDLQLGDGDGLTIISDRQKGLLKVVSQELPNVEHRMCGRHIYENLKKSFPRSADMKGLFWRVVESYNTADYKANIEVVRRFDIRLYEAMMEKNPENCSLAFFRPTACCSDVHNNISESFNNAIDPERRMPIVEMLETIRRRSMVRIDKRNKISSMHKGNFSLKAIRMIEDEQAKISYCVMYPGSDGWNEVRESGCSLKVNMLRHTCSCRKWDISGIPCRHALCVISKKKLDVEEYISDWYSTSKWQCTYQSSILPLDGMRFWRKCGDVKILPPILDDDEGGKKKGRRAIPKRMKGVNESPTKKYKASKKIKGVNESVTKKYKASREKRVVRCGYCRHVGHNTRTCTNVGGTQPTQDN